LSLPTPGSFAVLSALLVPLAGIPSGLVFHYLSRPRLSVPPFGKWDIIIITTWIAAWIFFFVLIPPGPGNLYAVSAFDPVHPRIYAMQHFLFRGAPVLMACGLGAGFIRLSSLRLGAIVAGSAWLIVAWDAVTVLATPLGPERYHFTIADRQFS